MAAGLNSRYGVETQHESSRQVDINTLILRQAQNLHQSGKQAKDLNKIPDSEWAGMHPGGMIPDKKLVASHMRAYENYTTE